MKNSIAVMELGTSKIVVLIGSRGLNNSITVDGIGVCDYDGFADGEWIAPEKLGVAISHVLDGARSSARRDIEKLYIGVPGDFLRCYCNEASISLGKKRRVADADVDMLFEQAEDIIAEGYTLVNKAPVYYTLDSDSKLIYPVGLVGSRLSGCASFMYADNRFIDMVDSAVKFAGISETDYVATAFAETQYLFDDYRRDMGTLLADVGAIETTVTYGKGDGICYCNTVDWGGDYITLVLRDALGLSRETADKLKQKINLCLDPQYVMESDEPGFMQTEYTVEENGEPRSFKVSDVNNLAEQAIKYFVTCFEQSIKDCKDIPDTIPLTLTGGGLNIRGATERINLRLHRETEFARPKLHTWDNPAYSAAISLLDTVLAADEPSGGFMDRIKKLFSKRK